jgi:hypothetical protein
VGDSRPRERRVLGWAAFGCVVVVDVVVDVVVGRVPPKLGMLPRWWRVIAKLPATNAKTCRAAASFLERCRKAGCGDVWAPAQAVHRCKQTTCRLRSHSHSHSHSHLHSERTALFRNAFVVRGTETNLEPHLTSSPRAPPSTQPAPHPNRTTLAFATMVRVKFRYLVVNFLYPEPSAKSKTPLPDVVQTYSPTPDAFHAGVLVRLIRDEVAELYGDYGMGMVSAGLKGKSRLVAEFPHSHLLISGDSQLLVAFHFNRHNPMPARSLRNGVGGAYVHHPPPQTPPSASGHESRARQWHDPKGRRRSHTKVAANHQKGEDMGGPGQPTHAAEC